MRTLVISLTLSAAIAYAQPRIDLIQNNYSYLLPSNPNYGSRKAPYSSSRAQISQTPPRVCKTHPCRRF